MPLFINPSLIYTPAEPTLPVLRRLRRYLRSAGRYGSSSFLIGHYGGSGEIAQGFCRSSAVFGGIYILGRKISSVTQPVDISDAEANFPLPKYVIELHDFPDRLTCNLIIASPSQLPVQLLQNVKSISPSAQSIHISVARCVAIIDQPICFSVSMLPEQTSQLAETLWAGPNPPARQVPDTQVLVFPPSSLPGGSSTMAATVLITGEGTMSAPKGKCLCIFFWHYFH
jgi:RAB protein geranylgeranyltransferase component A